MFFKEISVQKGFPDIDIMHKLYGCGQNVEGFLPVFYDIETTGLSRSSSFLYLIGAAAPVKDGWKLSQWFAQKKEDEKEILEAFAEFIKPFTCTIQYNGNHFDQPYIEERCRIHQLPDMFEGKAAMDLYLLLKPLKDLLKLPRMKQPDLEEFLGIASREHCDGKEGIRVYRQYLKSGKEELKNSLMGHNEEDIRGLGKIFEMLGYLKLLEGDYEAEGASWDGEALVMDLLLPCRLPAEASAGNEDFYIRLKENTAKLLIKAPRGRARKYYPNYKDYDYIPSEDTAMPKALSSCMDRSLRTPARAGTCYTWFDCTGSFLKNPGQQVGYLKTTLPFLIKSLSDAPQGKSNTPLQATGHQICNVAEQRGI